MTLNTCSPQSIMENGEDLLMLEQFNCLGSSAKQDGGANIDIQSVLNKAQNAFRMLKNMWRSSQYSMQTNLKGHPH